MSSITHKQFEKSIKKSRQELKPIVSRYCKWLKKHIPHDCKDYCAGCITCDAHHALKIIKSLLL